MSSNGILHHSKEKSNINSGITMVDINGLIKQVFTGNTGTKERFLIFYGTKKKFKEFIKALKK